MKIRTILAGGALVLLAGCGGWHYSPYYVKASDPSLAVCRSVTAMNLIWVQGEIDHSPQAQEVRDASTVPAQEIPLFQSDAAQLGRMSTPHAWFNADLSTASLALGEAALDLKDNQDIPSGVSSNADWYLPAVVHDCADFTTGTPKPARPGLPWYDYLFQALFLYIAGYIISAFAIAKLDRTSRAGLWRGMGMSVILRWCVIWFIVLPCVALAAFFRWLPRMMAWYALSPAERRQRRRTAMLAREQELERENGMS